MPSLHERAAALAARQHGIITRGQLTDQGVPRTTIDHRVGSLLSPVHPGTFRIAGSPSTERQELFAAVLAVDGSAVSHRSAARMLGAISWKPDAIDLTVGRWSRPTPNGVVVHRSTDLAERWVEERSGLRITTAARTIVDLGAVAPPAVVERALERLIFDGVLSEEQAITSLFAHARRGRRGCGVLRQVLDARIPDDVLESELEVRFRRLCREQGLPQPIAQHEVHVAGRRRRIDFAFVDLRIAIEVDGFRFHSSRASFEDDRRRGNALELDGWLVLRFTWTDVVQHPEVVASTVLRAIHVRSRH